MSTKSTDGVVKKAKSPGLVTVIGVENDVTANFASVEE